MVLLEPPRSKDALGLHYDTVREVTSDRVAILTESTGGAPALRRGNYQDVGEPRHLTFSAAGMYAGKSLLTMGNVGTNLLAELYYVVVKRF